MYSGCYLYICLPRTSYHWDLYVKHSRFHSKNSSEILWNLLVRQSYLLHFIVCAVFLFSLLSCSSLIFYSCSPRHFTRSFYCTLFPSPFFSSDRSTSPVTPRAPFILFVRFSIFHNVFIFNKEKSDCTITTTCFWKRLPKKAICASRARSCEAVSSVHASWCAIAALEATWSWFNTCIFFGRMGWKERRDKKKQRGKVKWHSCIL